MGIFTNVWLYRRRRKSRVSEIGRDSVDTFFHFQKYYVHISNVYFGAIGQKYKFGTLLLRFCGNNYKYGLANNALEHSLLNFL